MAIIFTKLPIPSTEKGVPGGVPTLDENGKIPLSQLPPAVGGDGDVLSVNMILPDEDGDVTVDTDGIPEGEDHLYYTQERFDLAFGSAILPYATDLELQGESNARAAQDAILQQNIDNEILARQTADTNLQNAINGLDTRLDTIEGTGSGSISKALQDAKDYADAQILTETTNRQNADSTLQGNIDAEALARQNADSTLQNNINTVAGNLLTEINSRMDNDGILQGNIDAEALTRLTADNTLQGNINTVAGNLLTEINSRTQADNTLQGNIDAEALTRSNADDTLQDNIDLKANISDLNTLSGRVDALEGVDSGNRIYALESDLTTEIQNRQTADSNISTLLQATNTGVGLNTNTGVYTAPVGSQFLGSSTSVLSALSALDTNLATVYNDFNQHHLHNNSYFVNDGDSDIQTVHDLADFGQGDVIYVGSGSYGGATLSLTKQNFAIQAPYVGVGTTICELAGGRGVNISGATCTRVRISNLQIEGNFTINNTEGRHIFTNTEFLGATTITNGTSNFLVFTDCAFVGQVSIASTVTATIYFVRCSFNGVLISSSVASPLQVILTDCSGLNASQANLATKVVLVGRTSYANNAVINYQSANTYLYDLVNGLSTTFSGAYSELRGKPTLVTASTGLSDSASLLRTSDLGTTVAPLTGGKIDIQYIPATVLTDVHVVADEDERLAIPDLVEGDYAIQTDDGSQWIYSGTTWYQVSSSGGGITTINGKGGSASITLYTDDISEDGTPVNLWFTDARARTASVVNSTDNDENNKAPSVSSIKSYISNQLSSKLDSSSYTASDVFAKVLTLDGTGSGLDADLLDGINSDAFVQTTGIQSIAGVKTFTDAPIVPDQSANNNSTKVANTKYVDNAVNAINNVQGANGTVVIRGDFDATSATPSLVNAKKGDLYNISVAGTYLGVEFAVSDQILFLQDVQGGVVSVDDFSKIDNTEGTLAAGGIALVSLASGVNKTLTFGNYFLYSGSANATLTLPQAKGTPAGVVLYLRHTGTGTLTISGPTFSGSPNSTGSYGTKIIYNNTGNLRTLTLTAAGEYKFFCTSSRSIVVAAPLGVPQYDYEIIVDCTATNKGALRTTDDLTEGTTNKYASATNVRPLLSATAPIVYTSSTGVISTTLTQYTDTLAKTAAVVNSMALSQTDQAPSVSSVKAYYTAGTGITLTSGTIATTITQYTDELSQDATASLFTSGTNTGIGYVYDTLNNKINSTVSLSSFTTTNLSEGTNLYYTQERVEDAVNTLLTAGAPHTGISYTYTDNGSGAGALTSVVSLGGFSIDALSDVDTTTAAPTTGQALGWDGSKWKPTTITGTGGSYLIGSTTSSGTINVETAFDGGEAEYVVICNGASTVLIPYPVTGNLYKKMIVKNFSNSAVTIDTSSSGAIFIYDGTSKVDSITMPAGYPGFSTTLYRIGNDWVVV